MLWGEDMNGLNHNKTVRGGAGSQYVILLLSEIKYESRERNKPLI